MPWGLPGGAMGGFGIDQYIIVIEHASALRDMKIVTREGCRVGQKMSYHFSF